MTKKNIVRIYAAALVAICLYVPWAQDGITAGGKPFHYNAGYAFVFRPISYAYVDVTRVALPAVALTIAFGVAWKQVEK